MSKAHGPKNFERLFLLEVLVDHLIIYNSKLDLDKEAISSLGQIVVKFQFLSYPPIEIREEDFSPRTKSLADDNRVLLKSGRSCMFSLSSKNADKICETDFDIFMDVFRNKTSEPEEGSGESSTIFIGGTKINMNDTLKDLICKSDGQGGSDKMTHTKTSAQKLLDGNGYPVGKIVFLIRVSCFGYMIVTGFQLSDDDSKNFKYKNITDLAAKDPLHPDSKKPGDKKPSKSNKEDKDDKEKKHREDTIKDPGKEKDTSKENDSSEERHPSQEKYPSKGKDSSFCYAKGKDHLADKPRASASPSCPFGFPDNPPQCVCPCAKAAALRKSAYKLPYPAQGFPQTYGPYQGSAVQHPSLSLTPQTGTQSKTKDIDMDPGAVAIRGNQLVFKMPDKKVEQAPVEGKFASSVYYSMGDEKKEGPRNVIQIMPQNPAPTTGYEPGGPNDKQDVLVLKLGKKRLAAGKKPKLELELRTPKMKREKPETDTQYTQYLDADIPKPAKKPASAKSSKKSKGKKK